MTPSDVDYQRAVDLLLADELVAIPTETVYGLGADAANPAAVAKIFAAKGRPADHPLIVHLAGHDAVDQWAEQVPPVAWELMETFWPGPLTLILKKQAWVPDAVTGGQETVGVRVPAHPVFLQSAVADMLSVPLHRNSGTHCPPSTWPSPVPLLPPCRIPASSSIVSCRISENIHRSAFSRD
mgnify:CR=1 FL=1